MSQFKNKFSNAIFGWIGSRAADAGLLSGIGRLELLVSCDRFAGISSDDNPNFVHSLEDELGERCLWSSRSIDELTDSCSRNLNVGGYFDKYCHRGKFVFVPYLSTEALTRFAVKVGALLAAPSFEIVADLRSKTFQRALLKRHGFPVPEGHPRDMSVPLVDWLAALARSLGFPFLVQDDRSSMGLGTYIIRDIDDLSLASRMLPADSSLLGSAFIEGIPVNVNAVAMKEGTVTGAPSRILLVDGFKGGATPLCRCVYGGNDFRIGEYIPCNDLEDLHALIRKIGDMLVALGYLGYFGVDLIHHNGEWVVVEINPRFQGSSLLLHLLEIRSGIVPLSAYHLRATCEEVICDLPRERGPLTCFGLQRIFYWKNAEHGRWQDNMRNRLDADDDKHSFSFETMWNGLPPEGFPIGSHAVVGKKFVFFGEGGIVS